MNFKEKLLALQKVRTVDTKLILQELIARGYAIPIVTPKDLQKVTIPAGNTVKVYNDVPTGYVAYTFISLVPEVDNTVDVDIYADGLLIESIVEVDWKRSLMQLAVIPFRVERYIMVALMNNTANDQTVYLKFTGAYVQEEYYDVLRLLL